MIRSMTNTVGFFTISLPVVYMLLLSLQPREACFQKQWQQGPGLALGQKSRRRAGPPLIESVFILNML